MPHSPSPDRSYDRRGPPKDWDAPEEEDGEISYTGNSRRSGPSGGYRDSRAGGGGRDRDRSRDRRDYRDRGRGRSRSKSPRGGRRGVRDDKDDYDDEEGSYRRRRDDDKDDRDDEKDRVKKGGEESEEAAEGADKPIEELTPEEQEARMMATMGFGGFDSTKGKKVAGADVSGVDIKKQRQYRQYMNRRGGFNRPLDSK
ncbi:U4/U6.U5 small nuclear ribonucleoprotein [Linnemannia zychae]|nr:U4/U6.U5 small nuclear ribonucleoprotein [Linnemannia zychae]